MLSPESVAVSLFSHGAPKVFVLCVLLLMWNADVQLDQAFQMSELFSGSATLASEFAAEGCDSASLDKRYGRGMDVNTSSGFGCFLAAVLRSKANSLIWLGVLCSSWVAASRGSTFRTFANAEGYLPYCSVDNGNRMAARSAFICLLAHALNHSFAVEQPRSSLLWRHSRFLWLLERVPVWKLHLWMGSWGSKSPKASTLWCNRPWISGFWTSAKLDMRKFDEHKQKGFRPTKRYVDKAGLRRWTGTKQLTDLHPVLCQKSLPAVDQEQG
ncbi:unnamed protein product [Effrenium voratum]|nr:unnamed protein product [Effrenium voratum]